MSWAIERGVGGSWFLDEHLSVGLEARMPTLFAEVAAHGAVEHETLSAVYAGPVASVATDDFWVTLSVMPQVAGLRGTEGERFELRDNERLQARLFFAFPF